MKYNLHTFTVFNKQLYVAEIIKFTEGEVELSDFLSHEELSILSKRKHKAKQKEFIFSRYVIKKVAQINKEKAPLTTIKYCKNINAAGIFNQQGLIQKLSLSHSGKFIAFSFCSLEEDIGVDIEVIAKRATKALTDEFFCQDDKQRINSAANANECFYQFWTEKEAVTKLVNTSIFSLLTCSSAELHHNYHLESIIQGGFIVSIAAHKQG
ncbi:MAG: 4'-phosphopantetheinyl transferase superfamily protein [Colwellia sp.]|nr:4'-phosphopantetheinyl transferase superfamily protein [Colwellia sp.]MCW8864255.1 4'-phosphopantetheinyl transferase superfamily protein [Colwellia sp.]MCW9082394.1 4'-phosphopantetheinyl transferase superfamily protein [Colwellia sp.]